MSNSKENSPVVLQVLPELEMGGVERGTVEIATYMQQHGNRFNFFIENNKIKKQAASVRQ